MNSDIDETLRTLEIFLNQESQKKRSPSESTKAPEINEKEAAASMLLLVVRFLFRQPSSEIKKLCLQKKRSEILASCVAKNLDFASVEKLALSQMTEDEKNFYRDFNANSPASFQPTTVTPTQPDVTAMPVTSAFYPTFFLALFLGVFGAHRFYTGKTKSGIVQLLTCGGLGVWCFIDIVTILLGKFKNKNGMAISNVNPKLTWSIFVICLIIGIASNGGHTAGDLSSGSGSASGSQFDPDPTGTWTAGDKNSVYSRLTVGSSGTFSFETVDFTGDVKGGYSGTWEMNGKSIHFEWGGGGADSGSCSGRKTGQNRLVFGSTTFSR